MTPILIIFISYIINSKPVKPLNDKEMNRDYKVKILNSLVFTCPLGQIFTTWKLKN